MTNPYKVLGVNEGATNEEIRAAYLSLVKKYHPDKYTDPDMKQLANEKLKEINEAYDQLTKTPAKPRPADIPAQHTARAATAGAIAAPKRIGSYARAALSTRAIWTGQRQYLTAYRPATRNGIICTA